MALRVAFFGTPAFAVPTVDALARSPHTIVGVVTQPDRPRGRGQKTRPGAVKEAALALGVPVLQPERLKTPEFMSAFADLGADIAVVAAYGKLLPQALLDTPRLGMINVHASLLPRWRGAAPIHRAILAGDAVSGITIMRVVLALDAGPMISRIEVPVGANETSVELEARLADEGARLAVAALDALENGTATEAPQDEALVTYAERLTREDSQIDWTRPAQAIHDQVRGLHPWPLTAAQLGGVRLRLIHSRVADHPDAPVPPGTVVAADREGIRVQTGAGQLLITALRPEGRNVMGAAEFLNGRPVAPGTRVEPVPFP